MTPYTLGLPTDGPAELTQVVRLATEHSLGMVSAAEYQQQRNTLLRAWAATWQGLPSADLRAQVKTLDINHILTPHERTEVFVIYYRLNGGAHRHADRANDVFPPDQYIRAVFPLDALDALDQEWLNARKRRRPYYKYVHLPSPALIRGLWWACGGGVLLVLFGLILGVQGDVAMGMGTMLAVVSGALAWSNQRLVAEAAEVEGQYRAQRMLLQKTIQGVSPSTVEQAGAASDRTMG